MDENSQVKCYVLASMSNELQNQYENMPTARAMITHLQELYGEQSYTACFEVSKRLFNLKMHEGDRKSTRLNSSHSGESRMPSSA